METASAGQERSAASAAALERPAPSSVAQARARGAFAYHVHGNLQELVKFADQKAAYHQKQLAGIASRHANQPIELPNDVGAVRDALLRRIDALGPKAAERAS